MIDLGKVWEQALESGSILASIASREDMAALKKSLESEGQYFTKFLGNGAFSLVFENTHGAAVRVESKDFGPQFDIHPTEIVTQPMKEQEISAGDLSVRVVTVPLGEQKGLDNDDLIRTAAALKGAGLEKHWVDVKLDQLVFLRDEKGEWIRYPNDGKDPYFSGKRVAFIADRNSMPADIEIAESLKGMGTVQDFVGKLMGIPKEDVLSALPNIPSEYLHVFEKQAQMREHFSSINQQKDSGKKEVPTQQDNPSVSQPMQDKSQGQTPE